RPGVLLLLDDSPVEIDQVPRGWRPGGGGSGRREADREQKRGGKRDDRSGRMRGAPSEGRGGSETGAQEVLSAGPRSRRGRSVLSNSRFPVAVIATAVSRQRATEARRDARSRSWRDGAKGASFAAPFSRLSAAPLGLFRWSFTNPAAIWMRPWRNWRASPLSRRH